MLHIPIDLRICEVISYVVFSFRILGRHVSLSAAGQLKTKTRDFCVIRESKPSGEYIVNFYRPKYVSCKKTESGRHMRCSRGREHAQGGRARPPPSCPSRTAAYFSIFSKYSKTEKYCLKNCFGVGLLTAPHTYSFSGSGTFWKVSFMYSTGVPVSITLVSTFMGLPEI